MNRMPQSPFGPAAEQRCNVTSHADLLSLGEQMTEHAKTLVEKYRKEVAKYQHLAEWERDARREVEARVKSYADVINQYEDLQAKLHTMVPDLMQKLRDLPKDPEMAEMKAQLEIAEKARERGAELLRVAEEERDAALRARDAAMVRLQPRQNERAHLSEAEALQARLDGATLCDTLEQAKKYCSLLVVTADPDEAGRLEHHQKARHWNRRLATALATMQMYAESKNVARARGRGAGAGLANLKVYCESQSSPLLSSVKVVPGEGKFASSSPRGKADRKLRVPEDIDPSGYAIMLEHIRIGDGSPPAPRLHYLDDTDQSGLIVVGFFGEHLTNTRTN